MEYKSDITSFSKQLSEAIWHGSAEGGQIAESADPTSPLGRVRVGVLKTVLWSVFFTIHAI